MNSITVLRQDLEDTIARLKAMERERDEAREALAHWIAAVYAHFPVNWQFDPSSPRLMLANVRSALTGVSLETANQWRKAFNRYATHDAECPALLGMECQCGFQALADVAHLPATL